MKNDTELFKSWLYGKSPNTVQAYSYRINQLLTFTNKPINETTLVDLQDFITSVEGSGNTKKLTINAIKSLFSFAHDHEYIPRNIARTIKPPALPENLTNRMLSEEDITKIIKATEDPRNRLLIRFLYITGGRVGEVCALEWKKVKGNTKGGEVELFGKSKKTRHVPFPAEFWADLAVLKLNSKPSDPVFKSNKGGKLATRHVWRIVRDAALRVGIEGVSPHFFRHSHASNALAKGASIATVKNTLGHSNISVTNTYIHAKPEDSSAYYVNA